MFRCLLVKVNYMYQYKKKLYHNVFMHLHFYVISELEAIRFFPTSGQAACLDKQYTEDNS